MPDDFQAVRGMFAAGSPALAAFDHLMIQAQVASFDLVPRVSEVRSILLKWAGKSHTPFAAQAHSGHINFYLRQPILRECPGIFSAAQAVFGAVKPNRLNEYRTHLRTVADVDKMLAFLTDHGAWPALSTDESSLPNQPLLWPYTPGEKVRRVELHERFGGRQQGGVSPSNQSPNLFLFTDPRSGLQHGYVDRWDGDIFHYTGEGQKGDQRMVDGNRAVLDHASRGRAIRVFSGARGVVEYVGEFTLDLEAPWYTTDAPETGGGAIRSVIVFRLKPVGMMNTVALPQLETELDFEYSLTIVPIEALNAEKTWIEPTREPYEAERKEAQLVQAFVQWIGEAGHAASRFRIVPEGEAKPLFSDIWIPSRNLLVEAKGTCTREAVRMAIGQLIDYGRFQPGAELAILLPSEPRPDLARLICAAGMGCFWPSGGDFKILDRNIELDVHTTQLLMEKK